MFKKLFTCFIAICTILLFNLACYTFVGQDISAKKLAQGKELNLYECASIYQMHTALWLFAWPASPAAANEVFLMQFSKKDTIIHKNEYLKKSILSERVIKTINSLSLGQHKELRYNGNVSYALFDKEHKAAMAINPCVVSKEKIDGKEYAVIRLDNSWPVVSTTKIGICGDFSITLHEGLFRYLQDKGVIRHLVDEYRYDLSKNYFTLP